MKCRPGCGACCIAISISSPLPGMPDGKPAGVPCFNLDPDTYLCRIWGTEKYPDVCRAFQATPEFCGSSRDEAFERIAEIEEATGNPS